MIQKGHYSLYLHVPFCRSVCSYCHFSRTAEHGPELRRRFVAGAIQEAAMRRAECSTLQSGRRTLTSAYLGGGTPSELESELMSALLQGTVNRFAVADDLELTCEANPESLDPKKAEAWRSFGVNRISLGVQSLQQSVLELLGRSCSPEVARRGLKTATGVFDRVSADWILGPGLKIETLRDELSEAVDLGVEHFSLYLLEIHEGTPMARQVDAGKLNLPKDDEYEKLYLEAGDHLEKLGIVQYEVANFARPGQESRHNQGYWEGRPWLGLGPSAHGFWGRARYANQGDLFSWLDQVEQGKLPVESVDPLDRAVRRLERVILGLRTREGVPLEALPGGALDLARGQEEGLWKLEDGRLVLTRRGFLRIDTLEERLARVL